MELSRALKWQISLVVLALVSWGLATRVGSGRHAFYLVGFGVGLCSLAALVRWWTRRGDGDQDDDAEVDNLRAELEALRQATAANAQAGGLPPPPQANGWDQAAAPPAQGGGMLSALHAMVTDPAATSPTQPMPLPPPSGLPPAFTSMGAPGLAAPAAPSPDLSVLQQLRTQLRTLSASAPTNPAWGQQWWQWISTLESQGFLSPPILAAMRARGYVGPSTKSPPVVVAMNSAFDALEINILRQASPATTSAPLGLAAANSWTGASSDQFTQGLPGDFRRAAPEIYRSIRGEGCSSVRQFLQNNFNGYRGPGATQWTDLSLGPGGYPMWSVATQVDMALGACSTDQEMLLLLASDDRLETSLRHLGAHFYEQRTQDRTGADHMRATSTPGTLRDVVPGWMVGEATTHSKSEFQRAERVTSEVRKRQGAKDSKGKGSGKGDKR